MVPAWDDMKLTKQRTIKYTLGNWLTGASKSFWKGRRPGANLYGRRREFLLWPTEYLLLEAGEAVVLVNHAPRLHDNMDERQAEST